MLALGLALSGGEAMAQQRQQQRPPAQAKQPQVPAASQQDVQACWEATAEMATVERLCTIVLAPQNQATIATFDQVSRGRLYYNRGRARQVLGNYNGAVEDFGRSAAGGYNPHVGHALIGIIYRDNLSNLEQAITSFRRALEINADYLDARINLAVTLGRKGDHSGSAAEYRRALEGNPRNAVLHRNLGIALYHARLIDDAIRSLETAVGLDGSDQEARIALIQMLVEKERHADAMRNLDILINASPDDPQTLVRAGDVLNQIGQYDRAADICTKAIQIRETYSDAYICRGLARANQGRLRPAQDDFDRALQYDPRSARLLVARGLFRKKSGDLDGAVADFKAALEIEPNQEEAHVSLIGAYSDKGELDKALQAFDGAQRVNRSNPQIHVLRAFVWAIHGDRDNAMRDLETVQQLAGSNSFLVHQGRGAVFFYLNDMVRAVSELQQAVRINANNGHVHAFLGRAFLKRGDLRNAEQSLARARQLLPSEWQVLRDQGLLEIERGNFEQAKTLLSQSIELNGTFAEAYVGRGRAYEGLRNAALARLQYEQAASKLDYDPQGRAAKAFASQRLADIERIARAPAPPAQPPIAALPPQPLPPGRPPAAPPRQTEPPVATPPTPTRQTAQAPGRRYWYCGLYDTWSSHSQRYSGVRVDLGCGSR